MLQTTTKHMPQSGSFRCQPLCRCTSWLHETTLQLSVDFRLRWLNDNRPISKWPLGRNTKSNNISSRISIGTGSRRVDFPEGKVERTPRLVVDRPPVEVHWGTTGNRDRDRSNSFILQKSKFIKLEFAI